MSVSLSEVLTAAGYDIKNNIKDARWFLSQVSEFEELQESANDLQDQFFDYTMAQADDPTLGKSFEEWRAGHERN
jgi:hypothetical protein